MTSSFDIVEVGSPNTRAVGRSMGDEQLSDSHPMGATMPQECVAVFTMCFMSEQLQVQFNVPSYQAWLDEQDMHPTYEFHKRFLQHAQSGGVRGGRWVLKSPAHLHLIDTLLDVFPDARIVHTHRDPIKVCASVASLTATLRGASTDTIDLHEIGRQQVDWWAKLIAKSLEQRKRLAHMSEQFFDVKMSETVSDPIDAECTRISATRSVTKCRPRCSPS